MEKLFKRIGKVVKSVSEVIAGPAIGVLSVITPMVIMAIIDSKTK